MEISLQVSNIIEMEYTIVSGKGDKAKKVTLSLGASSTVGELKKAYAKATKKDINRYMPFSKEKK